MRSKTAFIDAMEYLLSLEKKARDAYRDDIRLFSDPFMKSRLSDIRDDEIRHVAMVEEILSIFRR